MTLSDLVPYKRYLYMALIGIYSMGVWHVSAKYTSDTFQAEKTELVQKALKAEQLNQTLADTIGTRIDKAISRIQVTNKTINQEVIHEITKEPVYTNCVTTPIGVQLIESAIENTGSPTSN